MEIRAKVEAQEDRFSNSSNLIGEQLNEKNYKGVQKELKGKWDPEKTKEF